MRNRRDHGRSFDGRTGQGPSERGPMMSGNRENDRDRFRDHDRDRQWERDRSWARSEDMGGSHWSGASGRGGYESRNDHPGNDFIVGPHEEGRNEWHGGYGGFAGEREREGGYGGGWGGQREHSGMNAFGRQPEDRNWGRDFDRYDRPGGVHSVQGMIGPRGRVQNQNHPVMEMRGSDLGFSYGGHEGSDEIANRGPHYGKGPKGYKRSDERILEEVCECIARQGHIDASDVEVKVESGTVVLSGTVGQRHQKRALEQMIERLHGVDDIRNELRLKRNEQAPVSKQDSAPSVREPAPQNGKNARS